MESGAEFSVFSLILHASFGVQLVMFILFIASLYSWAIIFQKIKMFKNMNSILGGFEKEFWKGVSIANIYTSLVKKNDKNKIGIQVIFENGFKRFLKIKSKMTTTDSGKNKRMLYIIKDTFDGEIAMQEQLMSKDLAILATISSTAPYIGLFGTVWGILIAFWGFATETNVTIAVIAPHISEALIATGMGLIVAIPAQIAYNKFNSDSKKYSQKLENFSKRFTSII